MMISMEVAVRYAITLFLFALTGCAQQVPVTLPGGARSDPGLAVPAAQSTPALAPLTADQRVDCVLVDSDAGLDDLRAIAVLAPHRRIAAVVATEGIATPRGGARALRAYLHGTGIPVVEGASPPQGRSLDPSRLRGLDKWRANAEALNGTLTPSSFAASPEGEPASSVGAEVQRLSEGCAQLTLLAIGPWTSFVRYGDIVGGRLVQVVAQGSPVPDDDARGQPAGWNCQYDSASCQAAFTLLGQKGLRVRWVDIPQGANTCGSAEPGRDAVGGRVYAFTPNLEMAQALASSSGMLPARLSRVMLHNPSGLEGTSLWDDLAALYLLRPDIFGRLRDPSGRSSGHLEPCVTAHQVREMLVSASAGPPLNAVGR